MNKILLASFLLAFSSSSFASKVCTTYGDDIQKNCQKGDILNLVKGNKNRELMLRNCDFDKQIIITGEEVNFSTIVCSYVGKKRSVPKDW